MNDKGDKEAKPIKEFDFYEFAGLLAPGSVVLVGLSLIYPKLGPIVLKSETSVGDLGLFVILAYVAGHLAQSVSSMLEPLYFKIAGGKPSTWVFDAPATAGQPVNANRRLLSSIQTASVQNQLAPKLDLDFGADVSHTLAALSTSDRSDIVSQVYAAVQKAGRSERTDKFNSSYSLLRALAAAFLIVLGLTILNTGFAHPGILLAVFLAFGAAVSRMHRFSRLYAREVFLEFLQLPTPTSSTAPAPAPAPSP